MRFSERMGFRPVADVIQVDSMNDALRNGVWNILYEMEFGSEQFIGIQNLYGGLALKTEPCKPGIEAFSRALWADYHKLPVDSRPNPNSRILEQIRHHFFACAWHAVYDFVEFCLTYYGDRLVAPLNSILERELAG